MMEIMENSLKPFRWREHAVDPNDAKTRILMHDFLKQRRVCLPASDNETLKFFVDVSQGKAVLDVGVCEHTKDYMSNSNWKHAHISKAASRCLGIDILEDLVASLASKGFNVKCVDALSDVDIGERFDRVICGDVIEHVDNPVKLLKFLGRHLTPGGKIFVSTPNPYCLRVLREVFFKGTMVVNFDHITWQNPCTMNEVAARAGLQLTAYYLFVGSPNPFKRLVKKLFPGEMQSLTIIYELGV